ASSRPADRGLGIARACARPRRRRVRARERDPGRCGRNVANRAPADCQTVGMTPARRPHPLAPSGAALVDGASQREPMGSTDSKSGARFERIVIDDVRYVLKLVDRRDDWIARQTGDVACWPVVVWEAGIVDLAPGCIDHTLVGAARTPTGGAVLMRDVS